MDETRTLRGRMPPVQPLAFNQQREAWDLHCMQRMVWIEAESQAERGRKCTARPIALPSNGVPFLSRSVHLVFPRDRGLSECDPMR